MASLVDAWAAVAPGYLEHWVPRFRPFLLDALARLDARLTGAAPGPVAVPGCGPGEEVLALLRRHPAREVVALDPAGPMLDLLRARLAAEGLLGRVRLVQADAEATAAHAPGAAAVLSAFTLQLLERPLAALADWGRAVAPGGAVVVLFWPRQDPASSWGRLRATFEAEAGAWGTDWEPGVRAGLGATGLTLVADEALRHAMVHDTPAEAWDRLVDAGSLQVTARRLGPAAMERCRARWLEDPRLALRPDGRVEHAPTARLWTLVRAP